MSILPLCKSDWQKKSRKERERKKRKKKEEKEIPSFVYEENSIQKIFLSLLSHTWDNFLSRLSSCLFFYLILSLSNRFFSLSLEFFLFLSLPIFPPSLSHRFFSASSSWFVSCYTLSIKLFFQTHSLSLTHPSFSLPCLFLFFFSSFSSFSSLNFLSSSFSPSVNDGSCQYQVTQQLRRKIREREERRKRREEKTREKKRRGRKICHWNQCIHGIWTNNSSHFVNHVWFSTLFFLSIFLLSFFLLSQFFFSVCFFLTLSVVEEEMLPNTTRLQHFTFLSNLSLCLFEFILSLSSLSLSLSEHKECSIALLSPTSSQTLDTFQSTLSWILSQVVEKKKDPWRWCLIFHFSEERRREHPSSFAQFFSLVTSLLPIISRNHSPLSLLSSLPLFLSNQFFSSLMEWDEEKEYQVNRNQRGGKRAEWSGRKKETSREVRRMDSLSHFFGSGREKRNWRERGMKRKEDEEERKMMVMETKSCWWESPSSRLVQF